ncbi:MAG: hypothetical protein ACT4QD_09710 [Acidobacteriota bacterium]
MRGRLIVVAAIMVSGSAMLGAQTPTSGSDPFNGTWKLNVAKSIYRSGPPPPATATDLRVFSTMEGGWSVFVLTAINAQGAPSLQIVTYKLDGQRYPVHNATTLAALLATGQQTNVTRSYRGIDSHTVEFTTYTDGVAGLPALRTVSKDGQTYTQTIPGRDAQGRVVENVIVFDRVR